MTDAGHIPHTARMDQPASLSLRERLLGTAHVWCETTGKSLGSLSTTVTGTGKTLKQYADGMTITDAKLEQFARFLADPANWPDGMVAEEARTLAHVCGVSAADSASSAGLSCEMSGGRRVA